MNGVRFVHSNCRAQILAHVWLICVASVSMLGNCVGQEISSVTTPQNPPLLEQLKNRTDDLRFDKLLRKSTVEAESFRRLLLTDSKLGAYLVAVACVSFRDSEEVRRSFAETSYDLSRFKLRHDQIVAGIAGKPDLPDPAALYGSFKGKWYGLWEEKKVDHHWGDFISLHNPVTYEIVGQPPVTLLGYQYAWIGDGYGINHFVQSGEGKQRYLLGYVVHVRDMDPDKEFLRRPHIGVIDGPGRLIWITKSEVFFEEMVKGATPATDRYFITGFRYSMVEKSMVEKTLKAGQAFHAVYSRDADNRKPWRGFEIEMTVDPPPVWPLK